MFLTQVALLAVRDRPLPLEGPWDALVAAGYFGLLELAPVLLVLYYYLSLIHI